MKYVFCRAHPDVSCLMHPWRERHVPCGLCVVAVPAQLAAAGSVPTGDGCAGAPNSLVRTPGGGRCACPSVFPAWAVS